MPALAYNFETFAQQAAKAFDKMFVNNCKSRVAPNPNGVTVYRYIRNWDADKNNLGGVTFRFDINYDTGETNAWWAICSKDDNFSRTDGREWADSKAELYHPYVFKNDLIEEHAGLINTFLYVLIGPGSFSYDEIVHALNNTDRVHRSAVFEVLWHGWV